MSCRYQTSTQLWKGCTLFAISCSMVLHSWSQQQQPGVANKHKAGLLSQG